MFIILYFIGVHTTFDDFDCFGDVEAVVVGMIQYIPVNTYTK